MGRLSILFIFICIVSDGFAQDSVEIAYKKNFERRIKLSRIDDVYIPINIEDAIKELIRLTEPEARKKLTTVPEDTIASKLHFSLGRWILINWGFEQGSRLSYYFIQQGLADKDDMIDIILRCFYRHLNSQPLDEKSLIDTYIKKQKEKHEERKKKAKVIKTIKPGELHNE
ncbi:MAG: hypothetical protein HOP11_07575 [Saprospiraceae bacterium]|nr:hypothetical protein [Saprospiraceae bacterium]